MKSFVSAILIVLVLLSLYGCKDTKPKITEDQAKSIVIENHTNHNGYTEIISVTHKNNEYIVEWENKGNCENGIDSINDQNGAIEMVEASIC